MISAASSQIQQLTATNWISILALLVSLVSLGVSTLNYRRDRFKLVLKAIRFVSEESPGYIVIKAMNAGRRPMYLTTLWGENDEGEGSGDFLDRNGPGIKLGEHEYKEFKISHLPRGEHEYCAAHMSEDGVVVYTKMSFEDSLGNLYPVPGMTMLLKSLRSDYSEWCERTGYWKVKPPVTPPSPNHPAAAPST